MQLSNIALALTSVLGSKRKPALDLDFSANETLDPRITFSRTSNATRTNAQGLIEYAPHNLLTYSENFDNAVWVKSPNATATANVITAPDGTITCDKISYLGASTAPQQTVSSSTATYSFSAFVKKGNTSFCRLRLGAVGGSGTSISVHFNIDTGVVSAVGAATADFGAIIPSITQTTNDFYRISITFTVLTATTSIAYSIIAAQVSGGGSSNGDEIYIWGAQLNSGSLQPYYTTSVKNLFGYSQDFSNAAWTKINSSIDATPVVGPFGYLGAMKLVENTAATVPHGLAVDTSSLSSTTQYTFSVYAKAGERTWIRLGLVDNLGTDGGRAWFDLSNGVVGTVETNGAGSNINATINSIGGGWYRCRFTAQMNNSKTTLQSQVRLATANNVLTYTGDGTSGIYIFGAQLSDSASLDPYSYNFGAAPTSSAYYGPRFDYDPVTLAPKGLLIEEGRTNLALNSNTFNTSVGTSENLNATTSPDGTQNASLITETTINGEHYSLDRYIAITLGNTYVWSFYAKQGNGSARKAYCRVAIAATASVIFDLTTGNGTIIDSTNLVTYNSQQLSNGWWRCYIVFTAGSTGNAVCRAQLIRASDNTSIYTGDGVSGLYFWGAQLEQGAFPTSYIPTTSAQVTRTADNASMVGTNFSSWYNQSEGTVVCSSDSPQTLTTAEINWYLTNNAVTDTIFNRKNTSNTIASAVVVNSVAQGDIVSGTTISSNVTAQSAFSYKLNDLAISVNGAAVGTDSLANIPFVEKLYLGANPGAGQLLNGHIKSIKYYPTRLPNGDLIALSS